MKKTSTDEELIVDYFNGNIGAFNLLITRYRRKSKTLASSLLKQFNSVTNATFDDLVAIGIYAVNSAIRNYDYRCSFFSYWKQIAKNKMTEEIKLYSMSFHSGSFRKLLSVEEIEDYTPYISSPSASEELKASFLIDEIINILEDKKNQFSLLDEKIFLLYLDDKSYSDIAKEVEMSYFSVRNRVLRIKDRVANILKHSKE